MNTVFYLDQIKYYVDVGVKIVPSGPSSARRTTDEDYQSDEERGVVDASPSEVPRLPTTYLWKACCLDALYQYIQ